MLIRADIVSLNGDKLIAVPSNALAQEVLNAWISSGAQWIDGMNSAFTRIVSQYAGVLNLNRVVSGQRPVRDWQNYCNEKKGRI
jgi:hypothetical protein